ncbi:R body protein [Aliikangiella marina]|uniref:R body protein n=1 Tax=Aliikangiella marina TaxID=1712262 RepID=A0A545TGU6_9GAMM|nr:R body protein [Aliikangiella marina]TQV76435.1 R body protein [Aliikangiella marina]
MEVERIKIGEPDNPPNKPEDGSGSINILKTIAEQSSMLSNLAMSNLINNNNRSQQNTLQNQSSINQVFISTTSNSVNLVNNLSPSEARCATDVTSNNEVAQSIADLSAALKVKQKDNK